MDPAQLNSILNGTGITTASGGWNWANIIGNFIFGTIGFVAFMYGRKNKETKPFIIGLVLMIYSFFITNTWGLYGIGIGLTAALYFWRD